jgi:hypothetical protein
LRFDCAGEVPERLDGGSGQGLRHLPYDARHLWIELAGRRGIHRLSYGFGGLNERVDYLLL